jgi:hypothetical protein
VFHRIAQTIARQQRIFAPAGVLTRHLLLEPKCTAVWHHAYQLGKPVLHRNNSLPNPAFWEPKQAPKRDCHIEYKPARLEFPIEPAPAGPACRHGAPKERI